MAIGSGDRERTGGADGRRRGVPLAGLALGAGVLIGGVAAFVLARSMPPPSSPTRDPMVRAEPAKELRVSVERQLAARQLARFTDEPRPLLDHPDVVLEGFVEARRLSPPFAAVDATVFDAGDVRIKLADVWPVGRKEVCVDAAELRFACGLQARALLQNHLAGALVVCRDRFEPTTRDRSHVVAECRTDAGDLSVFMVAAGFAFPAGVASEDGPLAAALEAAMKGRRGVWAGPYDPPVRDRSIDDMAANPLGTFASGDAAERYFGPSTPMVRPDPPERTVVEPVAAAGASPPAVEPSAAAPVAKPPAAKPKPPSAKPTTRPVTTRSEAPAAAIPAIEKLAPNSGERPAGGVIAGPILPPPPGLAEKLGSQ